uniref:Dnaj homolog dnj-5 n=1 Tax=Triatoma infestans TaxID=30076 RepID=A0A171AFF0_TRIIF
MNRNANIGIPLATEQQGGGQSPPVRKQRIVAEVKPMRPSYSDVVAKSAPLTPPPTAKLQNNSKPTSNPTTLPKCDLHPSKKYHIKNSSNGSKSAAGLKRESSSGSDEALAEKAKLKRWSSQEELSSHPTRNVSSEQVKREKKRRSKASSFKLHDKEEKNNCADGSYREPEIKLTNRKETSGPCVAPTIGVKSSDRPASKPKTRDERKGSGSKADRNLNNSRGANKNKRTQRNYRKRDTSLGSLCRKWKDQSSYYLVLLSTWLINLLWDVMALSTSLLIHLFHDSCARTGSWIREAGRGIRRLFKRWWWWERKEPKPKPPGPPPSSLTHNITLPASGSDAIKRLLSCKGKDPYSILGVTSTCTDEEIKKYYKSQALLVHPDKNSQPGAEEAFKILVHAFDLIAEPTKRAAYDRYVSESNQVEQAWSELSDLLSQLHEKMEYAANTIRCNNCGKRHKREVTERPCYAARFCAQCKIHHSAKEGDMWAESRGWGWWSSRYLACIEGGVYDITEWAHCQGDSIQSVRPDSHMVQYRLVMAPRPEPDFEDLLNSLYSQNGNSSRGKKKSKKNK